MTNNDELALRLKKEIALANMNGVHPALSITPDELSSLLAERDADKKRIAELETGHADAAKQISSWRRLAKQNIDEHEKAVNALDGARQRIAELEARTVSVKLPRVSTERQNWTTWDWIQHLGGRYQHGNPEDYIEFGSVYAVQQMLKQFARTVYAQCQADVVAEITKQLSEDGIKLDVGE